MQHDELYFSEVFIPNGVVYRAKNIAPRELVKDPDSATWPNLWDLGQIT